MAQKSQKQGKTAINSARYRKKEKARGRWRETEGKGTKHAAYCIVHTLLNFFCQQQDGLTYRQDGLTYRRMDLLTDGLTYLRTDIVIHRNSLRYSKICNSWFVHKFFSNLKNLIFFPRKKLCIKKCNRVITRHGPKICPSRISGRFL